jgi:hypothetical protein
MYGGSSMVSALIPEVASRPLAWAVTAGVVACSVVVLAGVRLFSKARRRRTGGGRS